jgi:signal transduction histidine kinase/ActR/RegA family two-component response regulator
MADWATDAPGDAALAACCSLLHVLVDELGRSDQASPSRRRLVAAHALEKLPLPAAVFGVGDIASLANRAWRLLFGEPRPPLVEAALRKPDASSDQLIDFEVRRPDYVGFFSVTLHPLRATPGALAVAIETTDTVIAKQLDVPPDALVWFRDSTSDTGHYNQRWTTSVGAAWPIAVHHGDVQRWNEALAAADDGELPPDVEARLRMADGALRWHRVRARRIGSRVACWAIDIHTQRRREIERTALLAQARNARADADSANRIKDEFLAAVSHELRAPLTTMLLWERVLRDDGSDEASRVKALDAIHQSAIAQARLVADLLDFSRGISGKLFLDIRYVDLAAVAREAVEAAHPLAFAKSLELGFTSSPFVGEVHADATRLRQVIDNLVSNAIKFTSPGGAVMVEVTRHGRFVTLSVTDNGRGIAPALLSKIFDPFSQGDDALAHREGGLGLGLTISKQLVELHRGTLVATSEGLGRGARLTISLPAAGTPRAPSPPVGMRRTPKLDGARVLIVDDDDHVRSALAVLLGRVGAIVDTAESAAMGHARMAAAEPHVLICDIGMPDEDGYCFVRSLRAAGCKIPSIALTAYATNSDAQKALDAGFDVHLAKPISVERLVETLSELLEARRLST